MLRGLPDAQKSQIFQEQGGALGGICWRRVEVEDECPALGGFRVPVTRREEGPGRGRRDPGGAELGLIWGLGY